MLPHIRIFISAGCFAGAWFSVAINFVYIILVTLVTVKYYLGNISDFVHFVYFKGVDIVDFYHKYLIQCQKKNESPSAAAVNAGFTKTSVTRWKNGSTPTDATILALADYFDCSYDDLQSDIEVQHRQVASERRDFLNTLIDKLTPQQQIDLIIHILSVLDGTFEKCD